MAFGTCMYVDHYWAAWRRRCMFSWRAQSTSRKISSRNSSRKATGLLALLPYRRCLCLFSLSTSYLHDRLFILPTRDLAAIFEMDPLTAFGLAANVVSFISFASDLIKASVELYRSESDATGEVLSLGKVYVDLSSLSNRLGLACQQRTAHNDARPWVPSSDEVEIEKALFAVKKLAELCKDDCDELMQMTNALRLKKAGDAKSKWRSFRVAMKKVRMDSDIDKIEQRLHQRQATLTLHICTISGYYLRLLPEQSETLVY